jgi:hypothetical protein
LLLARPGVAAVVVPATARRLKVAAVAVVAPGTLGAFAFTPATAFGLAVVPVSEIVHGVLFFAAACVAT